MLHPYFIVIIDVMYEKVFYLQRKKIGIEKNHWIFSSNFMLLFVFCINIFISVETLNLLLQKKGNTVKIRRAKNAAVFAAHLYLIHTKQTHPAIFLHAFHRWGWQH